MKSKQFKPKSVVKCEEFLGNSVNMKNGGGAWNVAQAPGSLPQQ